MALSKRDDLRLRAALRNLQALTNPADPSCNCAPEAKLEVRSYVETWITPLVEAAIEGDSALSWELDSYRRDVTRPPVPFSREVAK